MGVSERQVERVSGPPLTGDAAGLRQWWTEVVRTHFADVHRFIRSRVPADAVDDLVQEVFVAAAGGVAAFDPSRGTLWAWLCGIARHAVAGFYRRTGCPSAAARAQVGLGPDWEAVLESLVSETPLPIELCEREELRSLVRAAMSALEPGHRACLEARYADGLGLEEVGRKCGLSASGANSLLYRARRELRETLLAMVKTPSVFEKDEG